MLTRFPFQPRWLAAFTAACALMMAATSASGAERGRSGLPTGPGNPFAALSALQAAASSGPAVYDANGVKVGDVVGITDMTVPLVGFVVNDRRFVLKVFDHHFFGVRVVFEAQNCAGAPLLSAPFFDSPNTLTTPLVLAGVAGPGKTVYVGEPGVAPRNVQYRSRLTVDGVCLSSSFTSSASVVDGTAVVDLDTLYSAPYSFR